MISRLRQSRRKLGSAGEADARALLRFKHYDILTANYRSRFGEIDIVARDGATLVFVEVKTRYPGRTALLPAENWRMAQRARLERCALDYLKYAGLRAVGYRFELIQVVRSRWLLRSIVHQEAVLTLQWQPRAGNRK